jgi:diguanylate cyclase
MAPTLAAVFESVRSPRAVLARFVVTVFTCLLSLTLLLAGAAGWRVGRDAARTTPAVLEQIAVQMAAQLDRQVADTLRELGTAVDPLQLASGERSLDWKRDQLASLRERLGLSWMGYAPESGTIVVATDRLLERQSALRFPWFRGGMAGPFVGEVHEMPELEETVGPESRFVAFAVPVKDAGGKIVGVLCGEREWTLDVRAIPLPADAAQRGILLSIYSDQGVHLLASDGFHNRTSLPVVPAAVRGAGREDLDGRSYFTGFARCRNTPGAPNARYFVAVRQSTRAAYGPAFSTAGWVAGIGAALSALLTIPAWMLAQRIRAAFHSIAASANRIGAGDVTAVFTSGKPIDEMAGMCAALNAMLEAVRKREEEATRRLYSPKDVNANAAEPDADDKPRKICW